MTDRPILYSAAMVNAQLEDRKTQTRRLLTPANTLFNGGPWSKAAKAQTWDWENAWVDPGPSPVGNPGPYLKLAWLAGDAEPWEGTVHRIYPRIQPGDRLWVRENHYLTDDGDSEYVIYAADPNAVREHFDDLARLPADFPADTLAAHKKLRPAIHMPRWASRLTDTVTEVRVERLQDIRGSDALAEGIAVAGPDVAVYRDHADANVEARRRFDAYCVRQYSRLWNDINGAGAWDANPWVVALTFTVERRNIDSGETP